MHVQTDMETHTKRYKYKHMHAHTKDIHHARKNKRTHRNMHVYTLDACLMRYISLVFPYEMFKYSYLLQIHCRTEAYLNSSRPSPHDDRNI